MPSFIKFITPFIPILFYLPLFYIIHDICHFFYLFPTSDLQQWLKLYLIHPNILAPHNIQNNVTNLYPLAISFDGFENFLPLTHIAFQQTFYLPPTVVNSTASSAIYYITSHHKFIFLKSAVHLKLSY